MKIYLAGMVYVFGCADDIKRLLLPDGRDKGHVASLWIDSGLVNQNETTWWEDFKNSNLQVKVPPGNAPVTVIEFRMPGPGTRLEFPDTANSPAICSNLNADLAKLEIKDQQGDEFEVDPETADTIAEVTVRGGRLVPYKFKNVGIVQWEIDSPPNLRIKATRQSVTHTITLNPLPASEVVLANQHDLAGPRGGEDQGDHFETFKKLNPAAGGVELLQPQQPQHVEHLKDFTSAYLHFMLTRPLARGETPPCCKSGLMHRHDTQFTSASRRGCKPWFWFR